MTVASDDMDSERYKKSPELVKEIMKNWPNFRAPAALCYIQKMG